MMPRHELCIYLRQNAIATYLKPMINRVFDTPEAVEAAFYKAVSNIDLDLMTRIWIDDDTALCIHPGSGLLRGKAAVMQGWMEIFSGSAPPLIEFRFIHGFAAGNLTVRLVEEQIRSRDKPAQSSNRVLATNVYLYQAGSWRLAEHHASLPLIKRAKASAAERQLH